MPKHRDGWLIMYSLKGSDDWRLTETFGDHVREPTEGYLQYVRDELGDKYDVDSMHYEVGDFPNPVRIIHG